MTGWTSTSAATTRRGQASSALEAWEQAVTAGCEIAAASGGTDSVILAVGEASACLYPAVNDRGSLDPLATQLAAERLLDEIRDELQPPEQAEVPGAPATGASPTAPSI